MSDMKNWLARKQGQPPQPQQPYTPPQQPYYQPQPQYPGYPPQQFYPPQPMPQYPQGYPPQPPPGYYQPPPPQTFIRPDGKIDVAAMEAAGVRIGQVARQWSGSNEARAENTTCPNCGGILFSRNNAGSVMNITTGQRHHPAPVCSSCSYSEVYGTQGDEANWVAS